MSWLSKLGKNIHKVVKVADPVADAIRNKVTPDYKEYNEQMENPVAPVAEAPVETPAAVDPSQGNASDPAYGSFTQPFDVQSFYQNLDPSYFFRLQQGQQGLVNSAAAGSGSLSGSALKDLMSYNQESASQEYGNAYNRYQTTQGNIFSRLMGIAGLGQASASNVGYNNSGLATNTGNQVVNAGTAAGAGIVGAGNSVANAAGMYGAMRYMNNNPVVK